MYLILDEFIMGGEIQETSKKVCLNWSICVSLLTMLSPATSSRGHCVHEIEHSCNAVASQGALTGAQLVWHCR